MFWKFVFFCLDQNVRHKGHELIRPFHKTDVTDQACPAWQLQEPLAIFFAPGSYPRDHDASPNHVLALRKTFSV